MADCNSDIISGRGKACKGQNSGLSSIYIFNDLEDAFTYADGQATAINPLLTEVFEFKIEGDGNTLVEDFVGDRNTYTAVNTQTLTAIFGKLTVQDVANFNLLVKGYPRAVVKDRNGNYLALGLDDGIDFTVNSATGGAKGDLNGYTLTGVSTTKELAPFLDESTITAFLALVA